MLERLLRVGIADSDCEIRETVLRMLDTRFDRFLAQVRLCARCVYLCAFAFKSIRDSFGLLFCALQAIERLCACGCISVEYAQTVCTCVCAYI